MVNAPSETGLLTSDQVRFYHAEGYLILPGLIGPEMVEEANGEIASIAAGGGDWYPDVTVDIIAPPAARRVMLPETPLDAFKAPIKISDLYRVSDPIKPVTKASVFLARSANS